MGVAPHLSMAYHKILKGLFDRLTVAAAAVERARGVLSLDLDRFPVHFFPHTKEH